MPNVQFRAILAVAFATGICPMAPAADLVQWSGNQHWYLAVKVGPTGISWADAQSAAVASGGYLATVTSSDENGFVYNLAAADDGLWFPDYLGNGIGPWLGGFQSDKLAEPGGSWTWVTGEPWSYANWAIVEPNNAGGQEDFLQYLGVQTLKSATWNDFPGGGYVERNEFVRGYLVEFDTLPVPPPPAFMAVWNGSTGNWSDANRWSTNPHAPNNGSTAQSSYGVLINGGTVALDVDATVSSLNISGGSLTGVGRLSLVNGTVAGTYAVSGTTTVSGTLVFNGTTHSAGAIDGSGGLQINAGTTLTSNGVTLEGGWAINGTHAIRAGVGNSGISRVNALPALVYTTNGFIIVFTSTLDLSDNVLIIDSANAADKVTKVESLVVAINSGRQNTWGGKGITSSTAAADATHYGVGLFDNAVSSKTSLGDQNIDANALFVTVALLGDSNFDGMVDINDLGNLANFWQRDGDMWSAGDLNLDGFVDINDLGILASNWQQSSQFFAQHSGVAAQNLVAVPEPGSLGLFVLVVLLLRRRCRVTSERCSSPASSAPGSWDRNLNVRFAEHA